MAVFQSDAFICVPKGSFYQRAQSKGTWTCRKSNFIREFSGRMPLTKTATTVLCESAPSKCTSTCHKSHFTRKFSGKMSQTKAATTVLCEPAQSKWKWTDCRNHFTRDPEVKCRRPRLQQPFCASLPSRNAHRHVTRDILCESCQGKCRRPRSRKIRGAGFVLACAVEMRMDMSQEKFYVRICRKKRQTVGAP